MKVTADAAAVTATADALSLQLWKPAEVLWQIAVEFWQAGCSPYSVSGLSHTLLIRMRAWHIQWCCHAYRDHFRIRYMLTVSFCSLSARWKTLNWLLYLVMARINEPGNLNWVIASITVKESNDTRLPEAGLCICSLYTPRNLLLTSCLIIG